MGGLNKKNKVRRKHNIAACSIYLSQSNFKISIRGRIINFMQKVRASGAGERVCFSVICNETSRKIRKHIASCDPRDRGSG